MANEKCLSGGEQNVWFSKENNISNNATTPHRKTLKSHKEDGVTIDNAANDQCDTVAKYPMNEDGNILREGCVEIQNINMILQLTSNGMELKKSRKDVRGFKKNFEDISLLWQDVIWAQAKDLMKAKTASFSIHYIQQHSKKCKTQSMHLTTVDGTADIWVRLIQEQCAKVANRPKKVFVIVNPIGGAGNSRQIYEDKVAPLFHLAQICTHVIFTERSKHALELAESQDFSSFDSIIVVGGDGLYQEILQGLTLQKQKCAGVDYNNSLAKFVGLDKPIGIIPTGTGNAIAGWLCDVVDVETSVLQILKGEYHRSQIITIHSGGRLICTCGLLFAYGFVSDIFKRTNELRWLKKVRYIYCQLAFLWKKQRTTHCTVEYCSATESSNQDFKKLDCLEVGTICDTTAVEQESKWIKHDNKGRDYVGIITFAANPVDKGDHQRLNMFTDRIRLFLDMGCSSFVPAKTSFKFFSGQKMNPDLLKLEAVDGVQAVRIKVIRDDDSNGNLTRESELEYFMDVDGESVRLDTPEIELKVVPSFVPLYGSRMC